MKIVDRKTFLSMPEGTVFAKYKPMYFENLQIKGETRMPNAAHPHFIGDFLYQDLVGEVECHGPGEISSQIFDLLEASRLTGASVKLDLHCQGRDGSFEEDQLFAVYEAEDVRQLIERLQEAMRDSGVPFITTLGRYMQEHGVIKEFPPSSITPPINENS